MLLFVLIASPQMMLIKLKVVAIVLGFFASLVASDDSYIPCKSYISFSYDDSYTLAEYQFSTQMTFVKNAIADFNHPEMLRAEGAYGGEFNWNSGLSIPQMQSSLGFAQQAQISYSLLQQFSSLVTSLETLKNNGDAQLAALIFISDTSDTALLNADRLLNNLAGVRLSFVLLGPNADSSKLTKFSTNHIFWRDLNQSEPHNWPFYSSEAYGCGLSTASFPPPASSTGFTQQQTTGTTTQFIYQFTTGPTTTTPAPAPYVPCKRFIHFGVDDSNVLEADSFTKQLNFISTAIGKINYPDRLQALAQYTRPVPWNNGFQISQIQQIVSNIKQAGPYSLKNQFASLITALQGTTILQHPIAALIFVSDTSDAALAGAYDLFTWIEHVQFTFVLMGGRAESGKLGAFTNAKFIEWKDLTQPEPDNWDLLSYYAYACGN